MVLTDDLDIEETYLDAYFGGNGDIYIQVWEVVNGLKHPHTVRISTSGGNFSSEVKVAAAELARAISNNE